MTDVLGHDFTPCPDCRISDSPAQRAAAPAAGVATAAEGDGLVVAAAPAGALPSTPAGTAQLPASADGAGPGEVAPSTRTPRSGATFTGIARACAAWLWTRRGVLLALAAALVLLGSCTDSEWGW